MAHRSLLFTFLVLLATMVLGSSSAHAARVVLVKLPGHPAAASVHDESDVSVMLVSLFGLDGGMSLVHVVGGEYQGWYRLVPGNVFFRACFPLLLIGDKLYVYGIGKTSSDELVPVLVAASLKSRRGVAETIVIASNEPLSIVPLCKHYVETGKEPYMVYAATLLGGGTGTDSSSDVFIPDGLLLARVRLGKEAGISSTLFPVRGILFTTQRVADGAVYVAGIRIGKVRKVAESLPRNTTVLIGVIHGDVMVLHEYRVPVCIMPSDILVANNTLYLLCEGRHGFNLVLLAVNLATWEPVWSASYNATALILGGRGITLAMIDDNLYVPITTGLVAIDPGTGRPLRAITLATTPTHPRIGLISITIARILGEPYLVAVNITGNTITLAPLQLLEGTKCIQAGDIALGEAKLAWTKLSSDLLGEKKVMGRPITLALSKISTLVIKEYSNVTEEHLETIRLRDCKPSGAWLEQAKTILKTTILTIKSTETNTLRTTLQKRINDRKVEIVMLGALLAVVIVSFVQRGMWPRSRED